MYKRRVLILLLVLLFIFIFYYFDNHETDLKMGLTVCTNDIVEQPDCYSEKNPTPILRWSCDQNKELLNFSYVFILEIDDHDDFSSPEFVSGEIKTEDLFYRIDSENIDFNKEYFWRIMIGDKYGTWSEWAPSDVSFITSPKCRL